MRFQVGDLIEFVNDRSVVRQITAVRNTGYTWRYPGTEPETLANTWISENSNDPELYWWEKKST